MIRVLLADDEPLARDAIRRSLAAHTGFELVGEAADGPAAVDAILEQRPDLVLLDVKMPGCDGFEVVARVRPHHLPAIVFVSAYDRHALRAFDVHAVDYLLKPYTEERFAGMLERARASVGRSGAERSARLLSLLDELAPGAVTTYAERFTVRERNGWKLVPAGEVHWFESAGNYVELHTAAGSHLLRVTMAELERSLDPERFARIHRTVLVNLSEVSAVRPTDGESYVVQLRSGATLAMSRRYRDRLLG